MVLPMNLSPVFGYEDVPPFFFQGVNFQEMQFPALPLTGDEFNPMLSAPHEGASMEFPHLEFQTPFQTAPMPMDGFLPFGHTGNPQVFNPLDLTAHDMEEIIPMETTVPRPTPAEKIIHVDPTRPPIPLDKWAAKKRYEPDEVLRMAREGRIAYYSEEHGEHIQAMHFNRDTKEYVVLDGAQIIHEDFFCHTPIPSFGETPVDGISGPVDNPPGPDFISGWPFSVPSALSPDRGASGSIETGLP